MGLGQAADRDMGEHFNFQTFSPLFNRFTDVIVGALPYNHNDLQSQFWPQFWLYVYLYGLGIKYRKGLCLVGGHLYSLYSWDTIQ